MNDGSVLQRIELVHGDITTQRVDAIVNAANEQLLGGGGVDGAIHRAAGPELLAETRTIGGCPTGEARITAGYNLSALWVIHTVGPVWRGGHQREAELLANCYRNVYRIAADAQFSIDTIAFPGISTGVYGYPVSEATDIALDETIRFLQSSSRPGLVRFVLYSNETLHIYQDRLSVISEKSRR